MSGNDDANKFDLTTREGKERYLHYLATKGAKAEFEKDGVEWPDVPYDSSFYSNRNDLQLMNDIVEFENFPDNYFVSPGDRIKRSSSVILIFIWKMFKSFLWLVFIMPGGLITWSQYYFPKRGKVYATGRRKNNVVVKVIFSITVWIPILAAGGIILFLDQDKPLVAAFFKVI